MRVAKATEDKALVAKQSAVPKSQDSTKCKFCRRENTHETDECEFRKAFNDVMEAFTRKQIRRAHQSDKRVHSQRRPKPSHKKADRSDRSDRFDRTKRKDKQSRSEKREHGHVANQGHSTDEFSDDYSTTDPSDDELVEHAHLTRDEIRKIPHSYWCSDSCASSHMTDDKSLFRSPLVPIRRRTILVRGG